MDDVTLQLERDTDRDTATLAAASGGEGCHGGAELSKAAARAAGNDALMDRFETDYPKGPHDQPQSMCPAFGSLRVGLRMRRVGTILSGSACCVYGLTFTSHFYGAKRSVGYVPFSSETLVTGKLYEDIVDAVHLMADPAKYDAIIVTNLCVPTASGVPLQMLPKDINGVRIVGIDVPGFGVPTHAEAKDVLSGAMLAYARQEAASGPVQRPRGTRQDKPTVTLVGEMFPADPVVIGGMLAPMGLAAGPTVPVREWRDLYGALDCAVVAGIHPFYTASFREFTAAGRDIVGSAPVGLDGTDAWLSSIGAACGIAQAKTDASRNAMHGAIKAALADNQVKGRITLSGYEGSELLVGRLLVEAGRRSALCRHRLPEDQVRYRRCGMAGGARRRCPVPRLAGAGYRRLRGIPPRPCHRHHARGPEGEGGGDPGAVLHQPDLGAAADGAGGCRVPAFGHQRRHCQQGPVRCHARLLRGRRQRRHRRHLGGRTGEQGVLPEKIRRTHQAVAQRRR